MTKVAKVLNAHCKVCGKKTAHYYHDDWELAGRSLALYNCKHCGSTISIHKKS